MPDDMKQFKLYEHRELREDKRIASAPYNFVPLPEKVVEAGTVADLPCHDCFLDSSANRHTGYFEVTLETRSPLYVRAALTRKEFDEAEQQMAKPAPVNYDFTKNPKNKADFFGRKPRSVEDANNRAPDYRPVIPGSSLRGMLRQMLEVGSYSKMDANRVANKRYIYRSVGDQSAIGASYREQMLGPEKSGGRDLHFDYPSPNLKGGYLKVLNDGWGIQPAKEWSESGGSLESFVHVEYEKALPFIKSQGKQQVHKSLFVKPASRENPPRRRIGRKNLILNVAVTDEITDQQAPGLKAVTVVESGHMEGGIKKHWHCAIYEVDNSKIPIPIPPKMWQDYVEDSDLKRGYDTRPLKNDQDPLFYLVDSAGNLIYFGSTQFFRLRHKYSTHDYLPQEIRKPETLDFGDAIFGYIDKDKSQKQGTKDRAYASRINVTDAIYWSSDDVKWLDESATTKPPILASPKPTAFQHYLVQKDPKSRELKHYSSKPVTETVVRGFKYYWHQGRVTGNELKPQSGSAGLDAQGNPEKSSTQHTQMRPVDSGAQFTFRIYFENLSDQELGALCWVLKPVGADNSREYCHTLGMGKPFGMGALKLSATLHRNNRQDRYGKLFSDADDNWFSGYDDGIDDFSDYTKAFEKFILEELGVFETGSCERLYQLERIATLLKMMEWQGYRAIYPASPGNRYLTDESRPNTRYMTIDKQEYRQRPVLPAPLDFDEERPSDLCEPEQDWTSL